MLKKQINLQLISFLILIVSIVSIFFMRLSGDGYEYFLTTHAFYKHGTPDILVSDVLDYYNNNKMLGQKKASLSDEILGILIQHLKAEKPIAALQFFPTESGEFYAMHFWMYSLLAVPIYSALHVFDFNPVWAFGFLNLAFVGLVFFYLKRLIPEYCNEAFLLFFLMGTVFYIRWTGPEVMGASCVFIACFAILHGKIGLAMLMSGLGATQNPSIILLMPVNFAYGILLYNWPQFIAFGRKPFNPAFKDFLLTLVGVVLALMSYAFFQFKFDTPSLIAQYSAFPSLIGTDRLYSLFFDLNQGMIVGLPGLIGLLVVGVLVNDSRKRIQWGIAAIAMISATILMAVPTLSTGNWNPGGFVMLRYNYWLGMPLLVLLIFGLILMPKKQATIIFTTTIILQGIVFVVQIMDDGTHTKHTPLARWVLKKYPSLYNPEAEIFFERSSGREFHYTIDSTYLYEHENQPKKILYHWSNYAMKTDFCPEGSLLKGAKFKEVGEGWQYLHPPFRCEVINVLSNYPKVWRVGAASPGSSVILTSGWSIPEEEGVWSDKSQSVLSLPVPVGMKVSRIRLKGRYYSSQRTSSVTVDGRFLGELNLANGIIDIPSDWLQKDVMKIILEHPDATSPKSRGRSEDGRLLGFFLEAVSVE